MQIVNLFNDIDTRPVSSSESDVIFIASVKRIKGCNKL